MNRMTLNLVRACAVAVLLATATGCTGDQFNLGAEESAQVDSVATLLSGVDDTAFRAAFTKLSDYSYTRYSRTEQFDTDDFLVAFRENVHRSELDGGARMVDTQAEDSAGTFDFGLFQRFTSSNIGAMDPVDLVPYLLPEDPPYLQGRNREKFEWETIGDTLLWDTQARIIEVRARPLHGDGENIRRVRHYVDVSTNELLAMYLERIDLALLFREESQFYVHMRRTHTGELVPHNARFQTHIRTPFKTDNKFRTVSTYYEVRSPGTPPSMASEPAMVGGEAG